MIHRSLIRRIGTALRCLAGHLVGRDEWLCHEHWTLLLLGKRTMLDEPEE